MHEARSCSVLAEVVELAKDYDVIGINANTPLLQSLQ